jgi:hypothetical protein
MRPGVRAAIVSLIVLAGTCVAFNAPAFAGGSNWSFDRPVYEPGDVVLASTAVAWAHNPRLGTPDDGPFGAWIAPIGVDDERERPYAEQIEWARYVTDVRVDVGPGLVNGMRVGPNVARATFVLPVLAPGQYELLHCNYPCTTTLGDITYGTFWVGPPDSIREVEELGPEPSPPPPPSPETRSVAIGASLAERLSVTTWSLVQLVAGAFAHA